jgi:hypothetical protein
MLRLRRTALLIATIGTVFLAGCEHRHRYYSHGPAVNDASIVYVWTAPPAPRPVTIPPRPSSSAIWIDGHWD